MRNDKPVGRAKMRGNQLVCMATCATCEEALSAVSAAHEHNESAQQSQKCPITSRAFRMDVMCAMSLREREIGINAFAGQRKI